MLEREVNHRKIEVRSISQHDNVNKPSHYTQTKIETIEVIRETLGAEKFEGLCIGNVIKYVSRYPYKNGVEDLKKAQVYLNWAIEVLEG